MSADAGFDVLIVGGGLVGASLARALSGCGLRIGLIEAREPADPGRESFDDRAIALAAGSCRIFEGMGLWPALAPAAEPICEIHVSDRGRFGFTRLSAREEGVPALGQVASARAIGRALLEALEPAGDVEWIAPARLVSVTPDAGGRAEAVVESGSGARRLSARLLVAADGGRSFVREALALPSTARDYRQTAVIANLEPGRPHRNVAYERFTEDGPLALLPMSGGRCALVWTLPPERAEAALALDDDAFLDAVQRRFGYRLGRFRRVGARHAHPLRLLRVREVVRGRVAVIGNAAHTLHPIAGQGFNLGLRDVAALADTVLAAVARAGDAGDPAALAGWAAARLDEQRRLTAATDGLLRLFTHPAAPVRLARDLGMVALDLCPPARHALARAAMGLAGRLPRLARGLPPG